MERHLRQNTVSAAFNSGQMSLNQSRPGAVVSHRENDYQGTRMSEPLKILVVEDNIEHLKLTQYILRTNNVPGVMYFVRDGEEAINYLLQRDRFSDAATSPRPNLILLDLNLPKVDGKEVLRIIKNDSRLKDIPVVVVSSSDREEDVEYASKMGAAKYISKSGGFEQLTQDFASIHTYADKGKP